MLDSPVYSLDDIDWNKVRPDIAKNILSKSLLPKEWSNTKMVFTKVLPNGEFTDHIDDYHHVLLFLKGTGVVKIDDKEFEIKPNLVVEIPAGTKHSYKNKGKDELLLITVNIPINE
ncbi:MAG: cupin domain-containing protein [Candidatus Heimdallarchaeota archaeon]